MATRVSEAIPRELRYEPTPKRVRALVGGDTVADSRGAILVWESKRAVPAYAFPDADVRRDLLEDCANPLPDAHGGGATFLTLTAGDEPVENAAWRYADPDLSGYVALSWEASTAGSRRRTRSSATRAIPGTGSTGAAALATSAPSSTASSSPTASGRPSSSRPACRPATTCHARTSRWTASRRPTRARSARTRASPRTGRRGRRRTSRGPTRSGSPTRRTSRGSSASSTRRRT